MIHESQTSNSNSTLHHTFTLSYAPSWPTFWGIIEGTTSTSNSNQLRFTYFDPKANGGLVGWKIKDGSLKLAEHLANWTGNLLISVATPYPTRQHTVRVLVLNYVGQKIIYGLHELDTTQEFTSWIFPSLNIQFP